MANGHGGARPGSGRKATTTIRYQQRMRKVIEQVVSVDDWVEVTAKALRQAKEGDFTARNWLSAWVMGKPPEDQPNQNEGPTTIYINEMKLGTDNPPREPTEAE